ncbi:MAG TPA: cytochrome b/b6 domain-containing protein [Solirubrobacteraceae bacterium]|nr:cytochrome b/b6 domain-containing protein [Solirubrobacteraceae bacterium]
MRVRRFTRSELAAHWVLALSVLTMIATGLALGMDVGHDVVFPVHVGGVFVLAGGLVAIVAAGNRHVLAASARDLGTLNGDDRRWFAWAPRAALRRGGDPPPVGRFNAGQKANAILVSCLLLLVTASGLYLWARVHGIVSNSNVDGALHNLSAVAIIVLVSGHLYMAVLNPGTRSALGGIVTGHVDAEWAAHHHPAWRPEGSPPEGLSGP